MAMCREIQEACKQKIRVFDQKQNREIHIVRFAQLYGENEAVQRLHDLNVQNIQESLAEKGGSGSVRKKKFQPVEYKGNFIGGKKAIRDTLFNRARGSRALQNATTLLAYLIQHSAWPGKHDKHKTYDHWYGKKKKIVASRSQEQMAIDLGVSVRSVQRWLDILEEDKLIRRETEGRENVYILGVVAGDKERYFYDMDKAWLVELEQDYQ